MYIAGDRVVSDLMSKPFSMGRNLLCINSKKHMANDDSKTKSKKMRQNMQTLKEMQKLMQVRPPRAPRAKFSRSAKFSAGVRPRVAPRSPCKSPPPQNSPLHDRFNNPYINNHRIIPE